MSIGGSASPVWPVKIGLTAEKFVGFAVAITVACATVIGLEFIGPVHAVNPGERAAIETTITLSALLTAGLLVTNVRHDRRLSELLLLCALAAVAVVDFVYLAIPALAGGSGPEASGGASLACNLIVSFAFAAAALAPSTTIRDRGRRLVGTAIAAGAGAIILAALLEHVAGSHGHAGLPEGGIAGAAANPAALVIRMLSAGILLVSGLAFLRRARRGDTRCGLLAGSLFLLGAARLQYLSTPAVAADWVTPREGLRLAAYAMLLASAFWQYTKIRRAQTLAAISLERERIARDLHDGLAQDLACIAVLGQRLGTELEPEHPLMIAARRALATSRGVIADLAASNAPDTEAALRLVAEELEHRYGLQVNVQIEPATALAGGEDLEPSEREHLVRITREAIVNAAVHGAARHVDVVLRQEGRDLLLRICDDGCGIEDAPRSGLGFRTMRARAASLGGGLSAHRRASGGTELNLVVRSARAARARARNAGRSNQRWWWRPAPPPVPPPPLDVADAMSLSSSDRYGPVGSTP
jgi:signal transduction histidine kinase